MDTSALAQLPTASSWYMNPYFAASFGVVVALGLLMLGVGYLVFGRLRMGRGRAADALCADCGITEDLVTKFSLPCKAHEALAVRTQTNEREIHELKEDYKELRRRVDSIERNKGIRDY